MLRFLLCFQGVSRCRGRLYTQVVWECQTSFLKIYELFCIHQKTAFSLVFLDVFKQILPQHPVTKFTFPKVQLGISTGFLAWGRESVRDSLPPRFPLLLSELIRTAFPHISQYIPCILRTLCNYLLQSHVPF